MQKVETPRMSAYSDREPPSENSFSLPPISLKLSPSPSDMELGTEAASSYNGAVSSLPSELPSHYSSRASSFMFSRRSSRMSSSSSPTKFPTISKSQSVNNLNMARGSLAFSSGKAKRDFRKDSSLSSRDVVCKSPSCPQFHLHKPPPDWNDYAENHDIDDDIPSSASAVDNSSVLHASTKTPYENDNEMKLPSIFSSNGGNATSKTKKERHSDGSLSERDTGNRMNVRSNRAKSDNNSVSEYQRSCDMNDLLSSPRRGNAKTYNNKQEMPPSNFLVPITEADRTASLAQNQSGSTQKNSGNGSSSKKKKKNASKSQTKDGKKDEIVNGSEIIPVNGLVNGIEDEEEELATNYSTTVTFINGELNCIDENPAIKESQDILEFNGKDRKSHKKSQKGKNKR